MLGMQHYTERRPHPNQSLFRRFGSFAVAVCCIPLLILAAVIVLGAMAYHAVVEYEYEYGPDHD